MAAASDSGDLVGTSRPLTPSFTTSRQPGTSVATTGNAIAPASKSTRGVPSRYEGSATTSASLINGATSSTCPANSAIPSDSHCAKVSSSMDEGFPGSGAPQTWNVVATPRSCKIRAASKNSKIPFSAINRPTNKIRVCWSNSRFGTGANRSRLTPEPFAMIDRSANLMEWRARTARSSAFWKIGRDPALVKARKYQRRIQGRTHLAANRGEINTCPNPVTLLTTREMPARSAAFVP